MSNKVRITRVPFGIRRVAAYSFFFLVGVFLAITVGGEIVFPGESWGEYWMIVAGVGPFLPFLAVGLSVKTHDGLLYLLAAAFLLLILIDIATVTGGDTAAFFVYSIGYAIICLTAPITATLITGWRGRLILWVFCLVVVSSLVVAWDARRVRFVWHWTTAADRELLAASAKGDLHAVAAAIGEGAHTDVRDDEGCAPLWVAAEKGYLQVVELLLKSGADAYTANYAPHPLDALSVASMRGHADVVSALLRGGIDPKSRIVGDALVWAALAGQTEVVKILVSGGADLGARNEQGATTLERAIEAAQTYSSTKTLELLEGLKERPN